MKADVDRTVASGRSLRWIEDADRSSRRLWNAGTSRWLWNAGMSRWPLMAACALRPMTMLVFLGVAGAASAASYRCDDAGRVTYSDVPCTTGRQTVVAGGGATPTADDRRAAAQRQRDDAAALADIARERREDERAAALAARRGHDRGNSMRSCAKLATAARRAQDDYDTASPRQQLKARVRMQRADEDFAALCKRKP